ncbi:MAG: hypothetical protein GYB32_00535 [Algicola sp.]|nr:hypothetical protein [Algicola sp.]
MKLKYLLLLALFALLSCSKDDDNSKQAPDPYILEAIIGSWAYDTVAVNGTLFLYEHTDGCNKDLFQFYNEEGKEFDFEEDYVLNCDNCADCAIASTNLKWDLYGDTIDLYFGEQLVTTLEILEVDETIIRYKRFYDFDQDGIEDVLEVTGIPYDPNDEFN